MLICVDLDGTLLDTVPANAASYRAALEELGFTVTDEYYAERCNGGHYTRFLPPLMGGAPSTADVERVHDRKKALYSDFLDAVRPNTALMEILKTMRAAGHDLACVTTGSKQNATEVLEHFGVREWFGLIVTGEDVEKQKPGKGIQGGAVLRVVMQGKPCSHAEYAAGRKAPGRIWNPPLRCRGRCSHRPGKCTARQG